MVKVRAVNRNFITTRHYYHEQNDLGIEERSNDRRKPYRRVDRCTLAQTSMGISSNAIGRAPGSAQLVAFSGDRAGRGNIYHIGFASPWHSSGRADIFAGTALPGSAEKVSVYDSLAKVRTIGGEWIGAGNVCRRRVGQVPGSHTYKAAHELRPEKKKNNEKQVLTRIASVWI